MPGKTVWDMDIGEYRRGSGNGERDERGCGVKEVGFTTQMLQRRSF